MLVPKRLFLERFGITDHGHPTSSARAHGSRSSPRSCWISACWVGAAGSSPLLNTRSRAVPKVRDLATVIPATAPGACVADEAHFESTHHTQVELRALLSGVLAAARLAQATPPSLGPPATVGGRLREFAALRDDGTISDDDFEAQKQRLLGEL
jgi:hypothetical protein